MSNAYIKITGDKEIVKYLVTYFPDRLRSVIAAGMIESLKTAETEAIKLAPVKTGALRRSIHSQVSVLRNKTIRGELMAGNPPDYAVYQEFGTYDKAINPDSVKQVQFALRTGISDNQFFKVGSIKSEKGIRPKLYLHGGFFNALPRMQEIFNIKLANLLKEVNAKGKMPK